MKLFGLILFAVGVMPIASCQSTPQNMKSENFLVSKTEEQWKSELTPEQFRVLRQKGTEYPGSGIYDKHFEPGHYTCAGCGAKLFVSDRKFDAHCGWPSFDAQSEDSNVIERVDYSHGMVRTEILCKQCGGHLGHVFNDGPTQTGLRYCVNSASLNFSGSKE